MGGSSAGRTRFEADLRRTLDRVGTLGLPRLAASFAPEPTRADAVRALVQQLADAAADLAGEPRRTVPRLGDQAVGDQLAVCGHDLLAAATADARGAASVDAVDAVLTTYADLLLDLRRRL
ncbi:MAG TPA: hypothetical protein VFL59_14960 [Candidatus Nanopelagicales bacterium]|nr:hypothetical protein [Candidatus Nanopelagicales bacterium]